MTRRVSVHEARANFSDLLGSVYHTGEPVIVERRGKPVAVLVSPEQYEQIAHERGHASLFATVNEPNRLNEEELARRRELVDRVLANREERDIRPLSSVDLIRIAREEEESSYGLGA